MKEKIRIKSKQNYRSISNRDTPINMQKLKKKYINEQKIKALIPRNNNYTQNTQDEVNYAEGKIENCTINALNYTNSTLNSVIDSHIMRNSSPNSRNKQMENSTPKMGIEQADNSSYVQQGSNLIPKKRTELKMNTSTPYLGNETPKIRLKQNLEIQRIYQKRYFIKSKINYTRTRKKLHRKREEHSSKSTYFSTPEYTITIRGLNKEDLISMSQERIAKYNVIKQNNSSITKDIKSKSQSYIKQRENNFNKIKEPQIPQSNTKENYKKSVISKSFHTNKATSKTGKTKKIGTIISAKTKSSALTSILAISCSLVVIIILIIVMISAFLQSSVGFLFADDSISHEIGDISIGEAKDILEHELDEKVEEIKSDVDYDKLLIYGMTPNWKDIFSIYAVLGTNRENLDITSMKEENLEFLRKLFWEVCEIDWDTTTYTVKHVYTVDGETVVEYEERVRLKITLNTMELDEMIGKYSLSNKEHEQLMELQKPEYEEMWNKLLAVG